MQSSLAAQSTQRSIRPRAGATSEPRPCAEDILSPRETQCLLLVADGQTSKEIARELAITLRTVDFHIHNAMKKLGVAKRGQAALQLVMQRAF